MKVEYVKPNNFKNYVIVEFLSKGQRSQFLKDFKRCHRVDQITRAQRHEGFCVAIRVENGSKRELDIAVGYILANLRLYDLASITVQGA